MNQTVVMYLISKPAFNTVKNIHYYYGEFGYDWEETINALIAAIRNNRGINEAIDGKVPLINLLCHDHGNSNSGLSDKLKNQLIILLLQNNADLRAGQFPLIDVSSECICASCSPEFRHVFAETIIRGDLDAYQSLHKVIKAPPTSEEIIKVLGERKLTPARLFQIKNMLSDLVKTNDLDKDLSAKILTTLAKFEDMSGDTKVYPESMKVFVKPVITARDDMEVENKKRKLSNLPQPVQQVFSPEKSTQIDDSELQHAIELSKAEMLQKQGMFPKPVEKPEPKKAKVAVPEAYKCAITCEIMQQPVICILDGRTYEKEPIRAWLTKHRTSPFNRAAMNENQTIDDVLIPNRNLQEAIEDFLKANPQFSSDKQKTM